MIAPFYSIARASWARCRRWAQKQGGHVLPSRYRPRVRCLAAVLTLVGLATVPAAAHAATLGLDQRCYVTGEQAALSGSGFAGGAPVSLTRGGAELPGVMADNSGAFRRAVPVPEIPDDQLEAQTEIVATDGSTTARAFLNIAQVTATYAPTVGDLRTLKVRHTVSGFGLAESRASIYLHYVSPAVEARAPKVAPKTQTVPAKNPVGVRTVRLGLLRGPCGVLRTSPRKLFPFKAGAGTWRLQYDTNPRFVRGYASSTFLWIARSVTVGG